MFYDITALLPSPSMFRDWKTIKIASLKNAARTVKVYVDPSDSTAVFAYFMHNDRAEAIQGEVSRRMQLTQRLNVWYVYTNIDGALVFSPQAPPADWDVECYIYLDIQISQPLVSISAITRSTQTLINLKLNRVVHAAETYENIDSMLRSYIRDTFFYRTDAVVRAYVWKLNQTEPRQIKKTEKWMNDNVRSTAFTEHFDTLLPSEIRRKH